MAVLALAFNINMMTNYSAIIRQLKSLVPNNLTHA
jgi:hypothetical protein